MSKHNTDTTTPDRQNAPGSTEAAQDAPEVTEQPTTSPEADTDDEPKAGNPEAARYRTRLRDTEAERDTLAGQVDALRRSIIDAELTNRHRVKIEGFWASGTEVADLLDDAGNVDTDKIAEAVATAKATLGLSQTPGPGYVPSEGRNPGSAAAGNRFADAFDPHKR